MAARVLGLGNLGHLPALQVIESPTTSMALPS